MSIRLNSSNFDSETSSGVALIDFFAEWCGPCHQMSPVIEELASEYDGVVKVCKVDVDEAQNLAVKFGIMSIPALFILKDGQVVKQFIGVTAKSDLVAAIKAAQGIA
jgi:thioredoxin 1